MEVQFNFPINDSPESFKQTIGFVIRFAKPLDISEGGSGQDAESSLVDDLIAGIQFRHDEMDGRPKAEHVMLVSILVRTKAGKRRQQTVVQIDNTTASKLPAEFCWKDSHIPSQNDVIDVLLIDNFLQN